MDYVPHKRVQMKGHPFFTEKWVQQRLADDPSLLGLGDLRPDVGPGRFLGREHVSPRTSS